MIFIDIDIEGSLTDEWCIAFIGPVKLTEEGRNYFKNILDNDVHIYKNNAEIEVANEKEDRLAKKLFYYAAGYCSCEMFDALFEE